METFSALLTLCVENSPVTGEFPSQRPVTQNLTFSLICAWIYTRLSKQSWGWWLRCYRAHYDVNVMNGWEEHESEPRFNIKTVFSRYGIPMLKIRRSQNRLIVNMGDPYTDKTSLYWDAPKNLNSQQTPHWGANYYNGNIFISQFKR